MFSCCVLYVCAMRIHTKHWYYTPRAKIRSCTALISHSVVSVYLECILKYLNLYTIGKKIDQPCSEKIKCLSCCSNARIIVTFYNHTKKAAIEYSMKHLTMKKVALELDFIHLGTICLLWYQKSQATNSVWSVQLIQMRIGISATKSKFFSN